MALPLGPTRFIYNSYQFPSNMRTRVTERPVWSDDGRTIKWSQIEITVRWYITTEDAQSASRRATAMASLTGSAVASITVTDGGAGYNAVPFVTIAPPDLAGGTQATATATVAAGIVTAITVVSGGNGYSVAPTVTISAPTGGTPPTTDTAIENIRRRLTKAGAGLIYDYKGFARGSLTVNTGGPIVDVNWGPKPGELKFTPLGGAPIGCLSAVLEWSVTTCIPECTSAVYLPGDGVFNAFAFTQDVSIDEAGYSIVTTTGSFEIPLSDFSFEILETTADANWEYALGTPMRGFRRTTRRTLSADRRRIDFTTTETQLPGAPLPRSIVKADVHQRLNNPKAMNIVDWRVTIAGSFTINAAVATKADAWAQMYDIIAARIAHAQGTPVSALPPGVNPFPGRPVNRRACMVLIQTFEADDSIFSDDFRFSVTYRLIGASLSDILAASGIWKSVGTDWEAWGLFMEEGPHAPRGLADFYFDATNDSLIDVCDPGIETGAIGAGDNSDVDDDEDTDQDGTVDTLAQEANPNNFMDSPPPLVAGAGEGRNEPPPTLLFPGGDQDPINVVPETSWLRYETVARYVEDGNVIRHIPLAGTVSYSPPEVDPLGGAGPVAEEITPPEVGVTADTPHILQQQASPSGMVILEGAAQRLGFQINPPRLISYGGIDMTDVPPASRELTPSLPMQIGGIPVYGMAWRITYLLPRLPESLDTPANPFLGTGGPLTD